MREQIHRIQADQRVGGPSTAGMDRFTAVATERLWAGGARTEPGMVSGWHHHGEQVSVIYILSGALRMEFGSGGVESFDAGPGDFVYVPRGAIHRESNPSNQPADIVVVRAGSGESVVNVDGPELA